MITVDGNAPYPTIKAGIAAANPGDTVQIATIWNAGGTGGQIAWFESINITQSNITIQAMGGAPIALHHTPDPTVPNSSSYAITISGSNVRFISNMQIYTRPNASAILLYSTASNCEFNPSTNYIYLNGDNGNQGIHDEGSGNRFSRIMAWDYYTCYFQPSTSANNNSWTVVENSELSARNGAFSVYADNMWFDVINSYITSNGLGSSFGGAGRAWLQNNYWYGGSTTPYHFKTGFRASNSFYMYNNGFGPVSITPYLVTAPATIAVNSGSFNFY
jgi:hypothetical protein